MPKPVKLSPSSIGLFVECPRCFWMKMNLGIKRPETPFSSLPSGMDRILKEHFDRHRELKTYPEELEGIRGKLYPDLEKLKTWRNNFRGLQYVDKKSGVILMGALDDLFVTASGEHAPLDFKTRGFPRKGDINEAYRRQMDIYSFLLEKNGLKPADFALLIFYHPTKVNDKHDVVFDPDPVKIPVDRKRGERYFLEAVKCMRGPKPEPSKDCGFCRWLEEVVEV